MHIGRRNITKSARRREGERGQIIIITAFALIVLFGVVGLAVDVGRMYAARAELGRAVDAAALSGVLEFPNASSAESVAIAYLEENEPSAVPDIEADTSNNALTVNASKTVNMFFIRVLGINTATISAHAKAGYGVLALDAAIAIDATGSMDDGCNSSQNDAGCPIYEAKEAAKDFKDLLLGTSPDGRTAIGVTAFRGCFRASPTTATAPMDLTAKPLCVRDDNTSSTWVTDLIYNVTTIDSQIDNIKSQGGSGTNVCGGLAKGWEILEGPGNHLSDENHLRYLVVLSDGDNNYYGQYIYQASPASPHTFQSYPCQPPSSCSNVGGDSSTSGNECHSGVNSTSTQTVSVSDTMDTSNWTGGTGWVGSSWTTSGTLAKVTTPSPQGTRQARLGRGSSVPSSYGTISRTFNLSSAASADLEYVIKRNSNVTGTDALVVEVICGSTYTLATRTSANTNTSYPGSPSAVSINQCAGQASVTVRFRVTSMNGTSDWFYVDTINIKGYSNVESPANGYLNGQDGSPVGCSTARKRERQMDMLTWDMAKAIKADEVEIFVVGFGTCSPDATVYTPAQCDAQIGNTDHDDVADERLLKCTASSRPGTNDHYFYAASSSELPTIFTQIAKQIGHRLIE